jgi:hypothetical protein
VIQRLVEAYKLWYEIVPNFPKTSRYTLGAKIDALFLDSIECVFLYSSTTPSKRIIKIRNAATKMDLLKFLLQISWELKTLDNKRYIVLSEKLEEIGRMLGGWLKQLSLK